MAAALRAPNKPAIFLGLFLEAGIGWEQEPGRVALPGRVGSPDEALGLVFRIELLGGIGLDPHFLNLWVDRCRRSTCIKIGISYAKTRHLQI